MAFDQPTSILAGSSLAFSLMTTSAPRVVFGALIILATPKKPFDFDSKNLRHALPKILYSINIQRQKMIVRWIAIGVCLVGGPLAWYLGGIFRLLAIGMLLTLPFIVLGFFADRRLLRHHQARLNECEHRPPSAGQ
jgi:hypothetical protein